MGHERDTMAVYDANAQRWVDQRVPRQVDLAAAFGASIDGPILDLGCGPGWHMPALAPAVGIDLSLEMLRLAQQHGPVARADLSQLPIASASIHGLWAARSLVHLRRSDVPVALAELHRVMVTGASGYVWVFEGDAELTQVDDDDFAGRSFSYWPPALLRHALIGAGFHVDELRQWQPERGGAQILVHVSRQWSLPDHVGPNMSLLICGLNPSPGSADAGVGFHRAGNRFWPAALAAGIVSRDRDPRHALADHGIGMTDIVKRPTRRADELSADEFRHGMERVEAMVEWLKPRAICFVGLAGWRAARNRKAVAGWQDETLGGRPVYLMGSTSGLNAHETVDSLAEHLRTAAGGAPAR